MSLETLYREALELTHRMLESAVIQDWDTLVRVGERRAEIIRKTDSQKEILSPEAQGRIAAIISEIERESAEIIERVQCWQEHVKILLRMNKPSSPADRP